MQHVIRLAITLLLIVVSASATWAAAAPKQAEYKRSDANFYWKGDVLKVDPGAMIITAGGYTQKGDSYIIIPKKKAPKEIYIQVVNDWIEPITPPDMPASLGVAPDVMQIREPQGDVQVALPSAPANFVPATDRMTIPNGAVVKTGANSTAAVLFGGVDSARLIPDSEAAVQQAVTPKARTTEVDLTKGAVFSKVGTLVGVKEDYKVKTPFGIAAARGTDFVSIALPARTDVWIAQGTVTLDAPDGKPVGTVKSEGAGALKIIRFPAMADPHQTMMASAETMTAAMNFIPMANVKIKALREKVSEGQKLTPSEQDYMGRIKKVPCLIKLTLVEPPAPPVPASKPTPPAPAPKPAPASAPAPAAAPALTPHLPAPVLAPVPPSGASAAPLPPVKVAKTNLDVRTGGMIRFKGATLTLDQLKLKLEDLVATEPNKLLVIRTGKTVKYDQIKPVLDLCHSVQVKNIAFLIKDKEAAAKIAGASPATATAATSQTSPETPMQPSTSSTTSNAPPVSPAPPATATTTTVPATTSAAVTPKPNKPKAKVKAAAAPLDDTPASTIP